MAKRTQFHRRPRHAAYKAAMAVAWEAGIAPRPLADALRYGARADIVRTDYNRPNKAAGRRAARARRLARALKNAGK
jgi:hypothetical protein